MKKELSKEQKISILKRIIYPFKPFPFKYIKVRGNKIYIKYKGKKEELLPNNSSLTYEIYLHYLNLLSLLDNY